MARPRLNIDVDEVRKLASLGCALQDIADWFGCHKNTISAKRFCDALKLGRAQMHVSLRRAQFKAAMDGSPALLIWLGKQYLGQRDLPAPTGEALVAPMTPQQVFEAMGRGIMKSVAEKPNNEQGEQSESSESAG